jgi:excinuclease ABC subunit C
MQEIKVFLSHLPHFPGVYQMLGGEGEVLYVGKARDLKKRVTSYFSGKKLDAKTVALVKHIKTIEITVTRNENEALLLECNLIKKLQPHYNILFRDDKSYPYILISTEQKFPRLDFYRGKRNRAGSLFGPFPSSTSVRETINLIQKLFQLRTCSDSFFNSRARPCLQYQIGRCTAPCTKLIADADYQQLVHLAILFLNGKNELILTELRARMESAAAALDFELATKLRDQMTKLREIQAKQYISTAQGEVDVIGMGTAGGMVCLQLLTIRGGRILGSRAYFPKVPTQVEPADVLASFIAQHYLAPREQTLDIPKEIIVPTELAEIDLLNNVLSEQALHKVRISTGVRGERKKWLETASISAQQAVTGQLLKKTNLLAKFKELGAQLQLAKMPERLECFDISHTMGEATVASCVVFNLEGPAKSDYRRFNINDITGGDDLAAMRQALTRRYKRLQAETAKMPDILLIDGGPLQVAVAKEVLHGLDVHQVLILGVAKGTTRKPGFETLHFIDKPPQFLASDSQALHLIQQIRDEAHRFAITGHRLRRDKKRNTSTLEQIPGIGLKRRRELLRHFGGIQAINRASLEELAKVPGINLSLAQRIFAALHDVMT